MSKKYGPVFTVHFGPKKVVVLASHKTVREALVGKAEEFGDRDISPIFHDLNQGHGTCVHQHSSCPHRRGWTFVLPFF